MSFILALFATFSFSTAIAQQSAKDYYRPSGDDPENLYSGYIYTIQETLRSIGTLNDGCISCTNHTNQYLNLPTSEACRKQYRNLYKIGKGYDEANPPEINMSLFFGYIDLPQNPEDAYAAAAVKYRLTGGCSSGTFACGFKQDDDDATLFTKSVDVMGPDGQTYSRTVKLRIETPSVSTSGAHNAGAGKNEQDVKSYETSESYLSALQNDDVVLYVGHARKGGGPDFFRPKRYKNGSVNYEHYQTLRKEKRSAFDDMTNALVSAKKPPAIVGVFACDSNRLFRSSLKSVLPNSGLVLSGSATEDIHAAISQAVGALDSALGMRCEPDVSKAINNWKALGARLPIGSSDDASYRPVTVDNFGK